MKILKKLFGGNSKIHVDEIAVAPGVLLGGAVIVESKIIGRDRILKFGDGTMIFTQTRDAGPVSAPMGALFTSGNIEITFPEPFIAADIVLSGFVRYGANNVWFSSSTISSDGLKASFRLMAPGALSQSDIRIHVMVIGRWK